uniref:ADP ribosyltransferase domain-containing protein n=1 Tax=viral metagenome TaxID=1070528 RepID=A0A6C0KFN1_9ZZZZ
MNQNTYVYDLQSMYIPSLTQEDVENATKNFNDDDNFKLLALGYSKGNWDSNLKDEIVLSSNDQGFINYYTRYLKIDKTPALLYHVRSHQQTMTNLFPRPSDSRRGSRYDIKIHNRSEGDPNIQQGDIISFMRYFTSFTYSNNYPFIGTFGQELTNKARSITEPDLVWSNDEILMLGILAQNSYTVFEILKEFVKKLDNEEFRKFILDFIVSYNEENSGKDEGFRHFLTYFKEKTGQKLGQFLQSHKFVEFYNDYRKTLKSSIYIAKTTKGIVIQPFSYYPEQDEVLITKQTKFIINRISIGYVRLSVLGTNDSILDKSVDKLFLDRERIANSATFVSPINVIEMTEITDEIADRDMFKMTVRKGRGSKRSNIRKKSVRKSVRKIRVRKSVNTRKKSVRKSRVRKSNTRKKNTPKNSVRKNKNK